MSSRTDRQLLMYDDIQWGRNADNSSAIFLYRVTENFRGEFVRTLD